MTPVQINRVITNATKADADVTLTRKGDAEGKSFTGKLVAVEASEEGSARYAVRTGKAGRPVIVAVDQINTIEIVTGN